MAYYPWAPQTAATYILEAPSGERAVFNDVTSTDYVGMLTDVTGLDSPEVREAGDALVGADGGWQGDNWHGRRPITLQGTVFGHADVASRNARLARLRRCSKAMRQDGLLIWTGTEPGALTLYTSVRRQQPLRLSGGWNKDFQCLLVSRFAPVLSYTPVTTGPGTSVTVENQGDEPHFLTITATSVTSAPLVITNTTTGGVIQFLAGFTTGAGHTLVIDTQMHTAIEDGTTDQTQYIDFVNSTWPMLAPGNNTWTTSSGTITLNTRSAWL